MKKLSLLTLITLVLLSSCSVTVPLLEKTDSQYALTTTAQLEDETYAAKIADFYSGGTEGTFKGKADVPIYYRIFRQPGEEKGAVMISSGRTEGALKYQEVIYDLYNNGYSVYIHDHRGQGLSGRMTDDPEMGYVDDFQYYIDDMKTFYDNFVKPDGHKKIFLLAHSLGGAIGMAYLEQFPGDLSAAAFSSPMLGLSPYICPLANLLSGKTPKYAPGQSAYHDDSTRFVGNDVTGSEIRYYRKIAENNKYPAARLGGASLQWLEQSCKQMKKNFRGIKYIETPFVIFTADNETVVHSPAYTRFITKAEKQDKECAIYLIGDAQHELLMEKDAQRTAVMQEALRFFEAN